MPTLPHYNAQRNIQTISGQSPVAMKSGSSDIYEVTGKALEKTQELAFKWSNALDTIQYTTAKANYETGLLDIEERATNDLDYNNSDKYFKELDELKKNSLKGIGNPSVENRAALEFDFGNKQSQIKINHIYKKKQIEVGKVSLQTGIDSLLQRKLNAVTQAEADKINSDIAGLLNINVQSGIISSEDAAKKLHDIRKTAVEYDIYNDPSTQEEDSQVLAELKKGPNGRYQDITPDERLDLIKDSQRRIFQNNQTMKKDAEEFRDLRNEDIYQKLMEGTLTLNDIEKEKKIPPEQGGIPMQQLKSIQEGLQKRIKTGVEVAVDEDEPIFFWKTSAGKYLNFIDTYIADETDRQRAREYLANAYRDKNITAKEASFLNKLKSLTNDIKWNDSVGVFKTAIQNLRWFYLNKKATNQELALSIKQLLDGVIDGKEAIPLSNEIIKKHTIQKNPAITSFSPEGQLTMDENGYVAVVKPDGSYKE